MITQDQAYEAVARMAALKYYPSEPAARSEIAFTLMRMVSTPEQLDWLVMQMIDRVPEWPGPMELRAVFCTKFKPRDGIEADSRLAGFTPADSENQYLFDEEDRKRAELDAPRISKELRRIQ